MKQILTLLLFLFSLTLSAQTVDVVGPKKKPKTTAPAKPKPAAPAVKPKTTKPVYIIDENRVYDIVEEQPIFNGNINQWLASNLTYPPDAVKDRVEGRVIVQFVVGKDGSIRNAQVVRGVDYSLDQEALRVVNSMPNWTPGKQNGKAVNCYFTLPIVFRLQ